MSEPSQKIPISKAIYSLVMGFDDEEGVPESVYDGTCMLIGRFFGEKSLQAFSDWVDAMDGRFYIKNGCFHECWQEVYAARVRRTK